LLQVAVAVAVAGDLLVVAVEQVELYLLLLTYHLAQQVDHQETVRML
jgi:hypothetical protein